MAEKGAFFICFKQVQGLACFCISIVYIIINKLQNIYVESALNNVNMGLYRFFCYKYCLFCIFLMTVEVILHKAYDKKLQKETKNL